MIVEVYLKDGTLIKHYSDSGVMIRQVETGVEYSEAVDLVPCQYTYEETDTLVDSGEDEGETTDIEEENADMKNALSLLGVTEETEVSTDE